MLADAQEGHDTASVDLGLVKQAQQAFTAGIAAREARAPLDVYFWTALVTSVVFLGSA